MRKHKPDLLIALLIVILMAVGLIVIYAIGPSWAGFQNIVNNQSYDSNHFFIRQLISVIFALGAFVVGYKFLRFEWVEKAGKWILLSSLLLCIVMAIMGAVGSEAVNCAPGACRWFRLPLGISFQPVEFLKIGLLIYVAGLIAKRKATNSLEKKEFWIPFAIVMISSILLVAVLQKDLGSAAVMVFMSFCMLIASGMRWRFIGSVGAIILFALIPLILLFPHRLERLMSFSGDSSNTHHIENALMAMGTGGFWGVGIGNSVQATGYLPESINDSVFAVMGETFGFVGLMALLLLFTALLLRLLKVADQLRPAKSEYSAGYLFIIGVFAWIAGHVIINIMGMTAIIPMKGITLPFLSYGGTSMAFVALAMGLCLQLSGWTKREAKHEDNSGRRGERRTYHPNHRRS